MNFIGGVRYTDIDQDFELLSGGEGNANTTVIDPVLGAQGRWSLNERWRFNLRGDIGGFGVGSEFTYQGLLNFGYRFGPAWGLTFGYRLLGYEIDDDDDIDLLMQGALVGFGYSW